MSVRMLAVIGVLGTSMCLGFGAHSQTGNASSGAPPAATDKKTSEKDGAEMVLVPAGEYPSGSTQDFRSRLTKSLLKYKNKILGDGKRESFYTEEFPERLRNLPAFYLDVFEVTNARYERFMKATGHKAPAYWKTATFSRPNQPVVGVGWADADSYCRWAGKRLPNEFEWEKAARGADKDAKKRLWPWGDRPEDNKYNGRASKHKAPVEVGSYPAGRSVYGVHDMAGNVWEMTSSLWRESDPSSHTMKGGSFLNSAASVRVAVRWAADDEIAGATWLGFRCALDGPVSQ